MSFISAIRPQAIGDAQENRSWYGGGASARRFYAYVGNDPINRVDPTGLCDNPSGCGGGSSNQLIGSPMSGGSSNSGIALTQATNQLQADLQLGTSNQSASSSGQTQTNTALANLSPTGVGSLTSLGTGASGLSSSASGLSSGIQLAATPNTGAPNSWYVNPGSGQQRFYGIDGLPALDIDIDHDHGSGSPHIHIWSPNPGGFPIRGGPEPP
jgi:hypothetical protein